METPTDRISRRVRRPAEAALSVSILFGLAQIAAGIPGGVLWLMARR